MILRMEMPALPQFQFEWHQDKRRLYVVSGTPGVGELVAENVENEEQARFAVQMWGNGYRARCYEFGGKHYRIHAEPGQLGALMGR